MLYRFPCPRSLLMLAPIARKWPHEWLKSYILQKQKLISGFFFFFPSLVSHLLSILLLIIYLNWYYIEIGWSPCPARRGGGGGMGTTPWLLLKSLICNSIWVPFLNALPNIGKFKKIERLVNCYYRKTTVTLKTKSNAKEYKLFYKKIYKLLMWWMAIGK